jgi:hypothetical protein
MPTIQEPPTPPAPPPVPVGIATYLGLAGTILLALATTVTTALEGADVKETKWFLTASAVLATVTIIGRMLQSAATLFGQALAKKPAAAVVPVPIATTTALAGQVAGAQTGEPVDRGDEFDDEVPDAPGVSGIAATAPVTLRGEGSAPPAAVGDFPEEEGSLSSLAPPLATTDPDSPHEQHDLHDGEGQRPVGE